MEKSTHLNMVEENIRLVLSRMSHRALDELVDGQAETMGELLCDLFELLSELAPEFATYFENKFSFRSDAQKVVRSLNTEKQQLLKWFAAGIVNYDEIEAWEALGISPGEAAEFLRDSPPRELPLLVPEPQERK